MPKWNRRKFLSLKPAQQHKKIAELLRSDPTQYAELCAWIDHPPLPISTFEEHSNAYHHHLSLAGMQHREHNLLIRTQDRSEGAPPLPIAIYLDHIRSAHNVGSIFRTTEAFSLGTLHLSPQTPTPANKQVRDASMETHEWVEWHAEADLSALLRPIIALETAETATPLHDFAFPPSFTLVLGNEEYGCSQEALLLADDVIEIPLRGRKNSLNVANAFAVVASYISGD